MRARNRWSCQPFVARAARSGSHHARHGALLSHRRAWHAVDPAASRSIQPHASDDNRRSAMLDGSRRCAAHGSRCRGATGKAGSAGRLSPCGSVECTSILSPHGDTSKPTDFRKSLSEISLTDWSISRAPQVEEDALNAPLGMPSIEGLVALRTNASFTHCCAVELGMGIGGLPTYIVAIGTDLIPVDIDIRHQVDIWMTYHPDARSIRRVVVFHRLAADNIRSQALSVVRRRIHSSA